MTSIDLWMNLPAAECEALANFLQIASALSEQMQATLYRSDVLRALIWPIGMLLTAVLGVNAVHGPDWLIILLSVLFGLFIIIYAGSYLFLLVRDRDALRSEKYSLQRLAIEHGLFGDSDTGLIEHQVASSRSNKSAITAGFVPSIESSSVENDD